MIYHYCSAEVFEIIAETKKIRLSDITKMNDEGEYKSGFQIIRDILKSHPKVDQSISTEMSPNNINHTFKVLIASFSKNGDLLSQWRAYADDGRGFSIGFDLELIRQHHMFNRYLEKMIPILGKIEFISVTYDRLEFEREVHELIGSFERSSSPMRFKLLARALMFMAIRYKEKFFEEEQEVRGFIAPEEGIQGDDYTVEQRETPYGDAYYYQLNTSFNDIHAIKEVVIGPRNQSEIQQVQQCLECYGLGNIHVKHSSGRGKYR